MSDLRATQLDPHSQVIDFGIEQPGFDLLPLDLIRDAAARRLAQGDNAFLNYGFEQGDGYFRQVLAGFLQEEMDIPVSPESLMVTAGASQGLDMICTHFARPGDTVFVEEPTYFLALRIFADRHLNVVGVTTDEHGLRLDALHNLLAEHRPAFLYTVPTFQNPSGVTLSADRRRELRQLAQQHDFFVVADEVYHLLSYSAAPPPPLARFSESERLLSLGSFSKILAPGLRLGWIHAAPALLQRFTSSGLLDSGGGLNPFTSNVVRVVVEQGWLNSHIAHLKDVYQRRLACMDTALQQHLRENVNYTKPSGGFFFWVALSQEVNAQTLLPAARERGVGFQPGAKFSCAGGYHNYMRLCFTYLDETKIEEGIVRLAEIVPKP